MSYEIRANYDQAFLLPPSLDDWVGADHPARFIRDFVDSLDLSELGFRVGPAPTGRPNYSSDLLLKVWLLGYYMKIRSTRVLEKACMDNMGFLWLTGMKSPDHNTLWRFVHNHRSQMSKVFKKSVEVAVRMDLVGFVVHAIDGTKIQSVCSRRTGLSRKELGRLLKETEASIEQMLEEVEKEGEIEGSGIRLPEDLQDRKERKRKIEEALKELEERDLKYFHPGESDARMMKMGMCKEYGYNAQIVADGESGLIVAEGVSNEANDQKQLVGMMEKVEETLGETANETLADGGYLSGKQLAEAEEREYEVTVSMKEPSSSEAPYHSSRFEFDREKDVCICPQGRELRFEQERYIKNRKKKIRRYRCHHRDCPNRDECTRDKRGRSIEVEEYHEAIERQRKKNREGSMKALMSLRRQIAELPFAQIKWNMGFRRWSYRGLSKVRGQWAMVCTISNLQKLYRRWVEGSLSFGTV